MSKRQPHHQELNELATELVRPAAATGGATGGRSHAEGFDEAERLIRDLQGKLSEAANDAEELITAHPLAAVASAFLLGLLLGRMMGRR